MIIECISCNKQFSLSDTMMPKDGSKVRCGSCLEVWFYHPAKEAELEATQENNSREPELSGENEATEELPKEDISKTLEQQQSHSEDEIKKDLDISKEEKRDFRIFTDEDVEFPSKADSIVWTLLTVGGLISSVTKLSSLVSSMISPLFPAISS